jgi:hypothetical protein
MDKPTTYVKITRTNPLCWYDSNFFIDAIFQVVDEDKVKYHVDHYSRYIYKADCEVVAPAFQQVPDSLEQVKAQLLRAYSDKTSNFLEGGELYETEKKAYNSGFEDGALWGLGESKRLPEGKHLISEEQVKELHRIFSNNDLIQSKKTIELWFPAVFVPAKTQTFKVGDRIKHPATNPVYTIIEGACNTIALFIEERSTVCNNGKFVPVKDIRAITKEELAGICYNVEEFTLLPDSTDQMV